MADNAEKNIHAGHRKRVKEQYLKQGLSSFHPHEVLELLLFFALPREDTNPLAHRLLRRFGSLEGVLNAPAEELMREKGVGTNTVILLRLIQELGKNAAAAAPVKPVSLASSARACQYVLQLLRDKPVEACYLLCLDCKHRLIRSICLNEGGPTNVSISPRAVMEAALSSNAASIILAHNHPGGSVEPSTEDLDATRSICISLMSINVEILDHIIVNEKEYYSLSAQKLLQEIKKEVTVRLSGATPPTYFPGR